MSSSPEVRVEERADPSGLETPVLLSVRGRNFLVNQGSQIEPMYVMMREWVQNPRSVGAAVANRAASKQPTVLRPYSLGTGQVPSTETGALLKKLESIEVPDIVADVENASLETHMPRWKALGRRMQLEGEYQRAIGFERLRRRLIK
jgi:hypothetical protein